MNYGHLACLVDVMTMFGHLMAVDRHGINRVESGPMLRCSFEETVDMLMDAAMYPKEEVLKGVTKNIMLKKPSRAVTGGVSLLLDEQKVVQDAVAVVVNDLDPRDGGLGVADGCGVTPGEASTYLRLV